MEQINAARLRKLDACEHQLKVFVETFGESDAPLTVETAVKYAGRFDWDWAANELLSKEGCQAYEEAKDPLWGAYEEARAPLWKAYREARAPLWKAYEEAETPLWKAYQEAEAQLWGAYEEARAPLWKAYEEAKAPIFAQLYLQENE